MTEDFKIKVLDNLHLGFAIAQDGLFKYVNKAYAGIYGYSVEEMTATSNAEIMGMLHPEDFDLALKDYNDRLSGKPISPSLQMRILSKDGQVKWIDGTLSVVEYLGKPAVQMEVMDITLYKMTEVEIKQVNERLMLALETNNAGTWDWDIVNNTYYWSSQFFQVFGFSDDVVPGMDTWNGCLHPDDKEVAELKIAEAIRDHKELVNDYRIILPSGEVKSIRAVGRTKYNEAQQPLRMVGLCIDITDRKNDENSLQQKILELERFNEITVGRELVMVDLKREINRLLRESGREEKYIIVE